MALEMIYQIDAVKKASSRFTEESVTESEEPSRHGNSPIIEQTGAEETDAD